MEWEDLVNLTPHAINVELEDKTVISIPPSGRILRLQEDELPVAEYVVKKKYWVDEKEYDTLDYESKTYIVSIICLPYLMKDRLVDGVYRHYDFLAPDTGPKSVVRDSEGRIIAVKRFIAP